jgi:cobalt-zinc-cadmium efflux system outer membrane protein
MNLPLRHPGWWSVLVVTLPLQASAAEPRVLTLPEALALAAEQSPSLAAADASAGQAQGDWRAARLLVRENPQVLAAIPTSGGSVGELEVTQSLGVTGQRFARARAGRELFEAARADAGDVDRAVDLEVARSFYAALWAEERLGLAAEDAELARALLGIATSRVDRGADAPITMELARIRAADAERRRIESQAEAKAMVLRLEAAIGVSVAGDVDPAGELPRATPLPSLDELVTRALKARPDVRALEHRVEAADAERRLAVASTFPEVTVGARYEEVYGQEGWSALVGLSPPIFDQNTGARVRARASATRAEAELASARIEVEAEVRTAWERWDAARRAVDVYDADVLAAQDESLRILTRASDEGKLDFAEVAVARRERLDGLLGNLDARLSLAVTEAELRAAAALPVTGPVGDLP